MTFQYLSGTIFVSIGLSNFAAMKRTPLLLFLLSLFCWLGMSAQPAINQTDSQGRKHGVWKKYYGDKKQLRFEGRFDHGVEVGVFTFYYPNGKIRAINDFRGKTGVCYSKQFTEEEVMVAEGKYIKTVRDSTWRFYDLDGVLLSETEFEKGKKNGKDIVYFTDGKIAKMVTYKNDVLDGPFLENYESGVKKAKGQYVDGKLHGEVIYYDLNGQVSAKGKFNRGLRHGPWFFFSDGKLEEKKMYHMGFEEGKRGTDGEETTIPEDEEMEKKEGTWPE